MATVIFNVFKKNMGKRRIHKFPHTQRVKLELAVTVHIN